MRERQIEPMRGEQRRSSLPLVPREAHAIRKHPPSLPTMGEDCAYIRTAQLREISPDGRKEGRQAGRQGRAVGRSVGRARRRRPTRGVPHGAAASFTTRHIVRAYTAARPSPGIPGSTRGRTNERRRRRDNRRGREGEEASPPLAHAAHGMKTRLDEGVSDVARRPAYLGRILDIVVVLGLRLGVGHLFACESLKNTGKSTIPRREFTLRPVALFIR